MSQVVKNNRAYLELLADFHPKQRQFLLMTATPQQIHALVQVIWNVLQENIPVSEGCGRKLIQFKDALVKTFTFLVQEGGGFIQDLLTPVLGSLGILML